MRKTFILVILDGWGIGRNDQGNPIYTQHPKNIAYIREHYRVGSLQASGISVGLPWEATGNSEFGHLTIGAGRTIPSHLPRVPLTATLGSVLADHEKTQLRIAETEKSPHITYFFNGYREEQYKNEYRVFIPSQNVSRLAEHPEMRAQEIGDRIVQAIEEHSFDFILANFANADMIAHTGDLRAAQKAVDVIDEQIGRIGKSAIDNNAILMITSDHGNIERVVEAATGTPQTQHDSNPVPIYLIGDEYYAPKTPGEALEAEYESVGILSDVAPTILEILGIPKPPEMTGESLLGKLY